MLKSGELALSKSLVAISYAPKLERKIFSVHLISSTVFVDYPDGVPTTIAAFDARSGTTFTPHVFNPGGKALITVGHSFSTPQSNTVCSLEFLVAQPSFLNSTQTAAVGGRDTLVSTCTNANGGLDGTRDRWSDLNDPLWDGGQIGENTQDILVVHHDPTNITPAAPGIPPLSLAPTPPQWKNMLLGAADVAGANEEYFVLRDRNGPDRTTLMVWNRKSRQWSSISRPPGRFVYRIFGPWLTADALTCETPKDSLDETCVSKAQSLIDLRTGKTLPIEDAGKDSEIILLAPDGKGLLRQGQRLSTFAAGSPVSTREKVAQNEIIAHVHWAWYR